MPTKSPKHIVIDARIRRASTGRPVDRLLKYLPDLDTDNRYTILVEPDDPLTFTQKNFTARPLPYKQFSLNPLKQVTQSWELHKLHADLVFFTLTAQAPLFYFGKNITLTHDLTMLRYARAGRLPEWVHKIRMIGYRLLFWKGNRFAGKIIVPTNFVKEDLGQYMPSSKGKTVQIYEACEPALSAKSQRPKDFSVESPFIFHVGSPFPHKNIEQLLAAFEILKSTNPDLKLVLAGKKEFYMKRIEQKITGTSYEQDVVIPGFISDAELKWLYENAECYVLPSLSEGFGLPGLEAMSHGCPLASSNATCLPEVYGEAAEYFDPKKPEVIAEAVQKIISSQKLKDELTQKGRRQVKKYSWQKMSREIHEVMTKVV